jgi:DNA-binding NarL/FixJ family response regulator
VTADQIRVLIADDSASFREGLRGLLESVADTAVVGEASDGSSAIVEVAKWQPDVVVIDLKMPGVNGIDATRRIVETSPHVAVLVLTMFEDDNSVFAAMRAGARGYLLKGANQGETLRAIRVVAHGEAIFSAAIARRLSRFFATPREPTGAFPELTQREREVLDLIAAGRTNVQIAAELVLSVKTVQNHVSNIFSKLQVTDRVQAILRAREASRQDDRW